MKIKTLIGIMVCGMLSINAQTAKDYYLPLCAGNYLRYYTPDGTGNWEARTTKVRIVRADVFSGVTYMYQRGVEIPDSNPSDSNVYQGFWLNYDGIGNVIIGAYDTTDTGNPATAVVIPTPGPFFANEFLTTGYSRTYAQGSTSSTDSTISITATAGAYSNCLQIRTIQKFNGNITRVDDRYYAKDVGIVMGVRSYPASEVHTMTLTDFLATKCSGVGQQEWSDGVFKIQLYPNPARQEFTVEMENSPTEASFVLFNNLGQQVLVRSLQAGINNLSIDGLPKGLYVYRVISGAGMKAGKLLIH